MKQKRKSKGNKKLLHIIIFTFIILLAVIAIIIYIWNRGLKIQYPLKYEDYVTKYAMEYEMDPHLVYSMIKEESSFREEVESRAGAIGLMQIIPSTGEDVAKRLNIENFNKESLYEPEININIGCKYFDELLEKYDNVECAIAAYNCGPNIVSKWLKDPEYSSDGKTLIKIPYKETREHVRKVLNSYGMYNKIYGKTP